VLRIEQQQMQIERRLVLSAGACVTSSLQPFNTGLLTANIVESFLWVKHCSPKAIYLPFFISERAPPPPSQPYPTPNFWFLDFPFGNLSITLTNQIHRNAVSS
jgi:hypothetical protein